MTYWRKQCLGGILTGIKRDQSWKLPPDRMVFFMLKAITRAAGGELSSMVLLSEEPPCGLGYQHVRQDLQLLQTVVEIFEGSLLFTPGNWELVFRSSSSRETEKQQRNKSCLPGFTIAITCYIKRAACVPLHGW